MQEGRGHFELKDEITAELGQLGLNAGERVQGLADEHVETSAKDNPGEPARDIEDEPDILDIPNPLRSPKSRST